MKRWFWIGSGLVGLTYAFLIIRGLMQETITISSVLLLTLMAVAAVLLLYGLTQWINHILDKLYKKLLRMMK
ncbi:hypothetical protein D3P07_17555 [Paenibacillus sp. 1011MAR3C5]|uniref:hypothetical protein n=1 Tax=Paenibacillus sp. 1011MAR3C5 TaxID=1675787 RepID=UPI000E6BD60D|nr:hypothetical protein [Paenibacillus sp. 1011MAR3C5]RJE86983.1 hypothetical protein D3P07_17555 [Paenibacillus sp. 1011MAR3C5]